MKCDSYRSVLLVGQFRRPVRLHDERCFNLTKQARCQVLTSIDNRQNMPSALDISGRNVSSDRHQKLRFFDPPSESTTIYGVRLTTSRLRRIRAKAPKSSAQSRRPLPHPPNLLLSSARSEFEALLASAFFPTSGIQGSIESIVLKRLFGILEPCPPA